MTTKSSTTPLRERAERWVLLDMAKDLGEYPSEIGPPDEECVKAWLAGYRAAQGDRRKYRVTMP